MAASISQLHFLSHSWVKNHVIELRISSPTYALLFLSWSMSLSCPIFACCFCLCLILQIDYTPLPRKYDPLFLSLALTSFISFSSHAFFLSLLGTLRYKIQLEHVGFFLLLRVVQCPRLLLLQASLADQFFQLPTVSPSFHLNE